MPHTKHNIGKGMNPKIAMLALGVTLGGCSSNDNTTASFSELSSNYVDLSDKQHSDKLSNYWKAVKRVNPDFPSLAAKKRLSGCVDIIVGINEDGKMGIYHVKSSYPDDLFVDNAIASLEKWRWSAAPENTSKTSVLTSIQLDFYLQGSKNSEEFAKHCD